MGNSNRTEKRKVQDGYTLHFKSVALYVLRDPTVTHICIITERTEEALLATQLYGYSKIQLGRSEGYLVYGISEPSQMLNSFVLSMVPNEHFDMSLVREMSEFKVKMEFFPLEEGGNVQRNTLVLLNEYRSESTENFIQFRNLSYQGNCVVFDLLTTPLVMEGFAQFVKNRIRIIIYE